jgi:hypothetical protein
MIRFELNGVDWTNWVESTYKTDLETLVSLESMFPAAKETNDYTAVLEEFLTGLESGKIDLVEGNGIEFGFKVTDRTPEGF